MRRFHLRNLKQQAFGPDKQTPNGSVQSERCVNGLGCEDGLLVPRAPEGCALKLGLVVAG